MSADVNRLQDGVSFTYEEVQKLKDMIEITKKIQSMIKLNQKGAVLTEFAIIVILFYMLAAGTLTFGGLFLSAQSVQEVARLSARELALTPIPAALTFEEAMYSEPTDYPVGDPRRAAIESLRDRLFDEEWLIIDLDNDLGGDTIDNLFATLPIINQSMRSLMIYDEAEGRRLLRYPGALEIDGTSRTGYRVRLPIINARDAEGVETDITFVPVIEEVDDPATNPDPFLPANGGIVALRVNFPYQSASMSGYMQEDRGVFDTNIDNPILADDEAVGNLGDFVETGFEVDGELMGPYAGTYGLGRQFAMGQPVRPFRKFLSAQAMFRREIFA